MKKKDKNAMDKAAFDFDFYIVLLMTLLKTHGFMLEFNKKNLPLRNLILLGISLIIKPILKNFEEYILDMVSKIVIYLLYNNKLF